MDRRVAEQIVPMRTRAAEEVCATIDVFKAHASKDQLKAYAKAGNSETVSVNATIKVWKLYGKAGLLRALREGQPLARSGAASDCVTSGGGH